MPTLINAVNCKKFVSGTGLVDCEPFFLEPNSVIVTPVNWSFPLTETFDLDYVVSKVQDGTFVPFLNAVQFTENTGDPTRVDYTGGNRRTVRNANPDYTFEFDNGIGFHTAAYSYNGVKGRIIFIDEAGNVQLQRNVAGTALTGFLADDINTRTYRQKSGDTRPATMLEIHLDNPEEFNRQMVMISRDTINANLNSELNGVVSVNITAVSASVANGVVVDVIAVNNSNFGIEGLGATNFDIVNITDNNVATVGTATASTSVIGRYTLTGATPAFGSGDSIRVRTKGFGVNSATIIVDTTQLYKGEQTTPITATA